MTHATSSAARAWMWAWLVCLPGANVCAAEQAMPDTVVAVNGSQGPATWRPADDEIVATMLPKGYRDGDNHKAYVGAEAVQTWWRGARNSGAARRNALGNCRESGGEDCELLAVGDSFQAEFDDWFVARVGYLDLDSDRDYVVIGDEGAPVTMITFLSYTCPECAKFFLSSYQRLRQDYVATGRLRWVIRDFPRNDLDIEAGLLLRCFPPERFFELVETLYQKRDTWKKDTGALLRFGETMGATPAQLGACLADDSRRQLILASRYEGARMFHVGQTPGVSINGLVFHGYRSTDDLLGAIERTLVAAN